LNIMNTTENVSTKSTAIQEPPSNARTLLDILNVFTKD
jgi:hypothetical protein